MDDLRRAADSALAGAVVVEADRENDRENHDLADLASNDPLVAATVGRLDLHSHDFAEQLRRRSNDPLFRGIRYSLRLDQDGAWTTAAAANARRLAATGRLLEVLAPPGQLGKSVLIAASVPETTVVVDHLAYVPPKPDDIAAWTTALEALASLPNVVGKLSHFRLPLGWDDLTRIRHVVETFGPSRLMFGSNWPVCLRFGEHADIVKTALVACEPLTDDDRESIMHGTAARVFGIGRHHQAIRRLQRREVLRRG